MNRARLAAALTVLGVMLIAAGAALIYPPAGVIVLGVLLAAVGLFGIDDGEGRPR